MVHIKRFLRAEDGAVTVDWVTFSCSAALLRLPVLTTARKVLRAVMFILVGLNNSGLSNYYDK